MFNFCKCKKRFLHVQANWRFFFTQVGKTGKGNDSKPYFLKIFKKEKKNSRDLVKKNPVQ